MARAASVATPLWVRAALVAVVVGVPLWWGLQARDRAGNEARLGRIASEIAGRRVQVDCPGVLGRIFGWDMVEGSVRFDASGRPADEAQLRAFACAELDAIAEGRRADVLACVAGGGDCGTAGDDAATAVDVLTHESFHLAGIADEAQTECRSLQAMAMTAQRLGATPDQGHALAARQYAVGYPLMPERYRSAACRDGGDWDVRPEDPVWP